jgi:hypothetical protein
MLKLAAREGLVLRKSALYENVPSSPRVLPSFDQMTSPGYSSPAVITDLIINDLARLS